LEQQDELKAWLFIAQPSPTSKCEKRFRRLLKLRVEAVGISPQEPVFFRHQNVIISPCLLAKTCCEQLVNNKKYVSLVRLPTESLKLLSFSEEKLGVERFLGFPS